jgi:hypothetical protein
MSISLSIGMSMNMNMNEYSTWLKTPKLLLFAACSVCFAVWSDAQGP